MKVEDLPEDTMVIDDRNEALIGFGWRLNTPIAVYDRDKLVESMVKEGMDVDDADEYISYNIEGAYLGEGTPLVVTLDEVESVEAPPDA